MFSPHAWGVSFGATAAAVCALFVAAPVTAVERPVIEVNATTVAPIRAPAVEWVAVEPPTILISDTSNPQAVTIARRYLGTPYVRGAESPSRGFDCSGLTWYVYRQLGISIPRTTDGLRAAGTVVTHPKPGDLVWNPGHVGIYVRPGVMIAAPHAGAVVVEQPIYFDNPVYLRFTK